MSLVSRSKPGRFMVNKKTRSSSVVTVALVGPVGTTNLCPARIAMVHAHHDAGICHRRAGQMLHHMPERSSSRPLIQAGGLRWKRSPNARSVSLFRWHILDTED